MGLIAAIRRLERGFGWSFLGFILAAVFGAVSLYTEFWRHNSALLEYQLLSNTPVIDVREKLPELEVIYQKQDIAKNGRALSVLLVRIINRGSVNILISDYDTKAPLGMIIRGATVLRAELASASSSYLARVVAVHVQNTSVITLEPVILEPGEWYLVKLLVLHRADTQPSALAQGKIAGMRSPPLVVPTLATEHEGFWRRALSGGVWIQLARVPAYFLGAVLSLALLIAPPALISFALTTRKRRLIVRRFRAAKGLPPEGPDDFLFRRYIANGFPEVKVLSSILTQDQERLHARVSRYVKRKEGRVGHVPEEEVAFRTNSKVMPEGPRGYYHTPYLGNLIEAGILKKKGEEWTVDPERLKTVTAFVEYLEFMGATD